MYSNFLLLNKMKGGNSNEYVKLKDIIMRTDRESPPSTSSPFIKLIFDGMEGLGIPDL